MFTIPTISHVITKYKTKEKEFEKQRGKIKSKSIDKNVKEKIKKSTFEIFSRMKGKKKILQSKKKKICEQMKMKMKK